MASKIFFLTLFFVTTFSFSHGDHGHSHPSAQAASSFVSEVTSLVEKEGLNLPAFADKRWITVRGQKVDLPAGYNAQKVWQALEFAKNYELKTQALLKLSGCGHSCASCPSNCAAVNSQASKASLLKKLTLKLKKIPDTAADVSVELSLAATELFTQFSVVSFAFIIATQVSWEIVETVVSWSLGLGGMHALCHVFNMALLASTVTVENNLKALVSFPKSKRFKDRFKSSLSILLLTIEKIKLLKKAEFNNDGLSFERAAKDYLSQHRSDLEETILSNTSWPLIDLRNSSDLEDQAVSDELVHPLDFLALPNVNVAERIVESQLNYELFQMMYKASKGAVLDDDIKLSSRYKYAWLLGKVKKQMRQYYLALEMMALSDQEFRVLKLKEFKLLYADMVAVFKSLGRFVELTDAKLPSNIATELEYRKVDLNLALKKAHAANKAFVRETKGNSCSKHLAIGSTH